MLVEIERTTHPEAGITLRILERTGEFQFHSVERLDEKTAGTSRESWNKIGAATDSLEEARRQAALYASHVVEVRGLNRQPLDYGPRDRAPRTPWGTAQYGTAYAPGVRKFSSARHGGYKLDAAHNAGVHPALRNEGGWYEEDCEWAVVAHSYPHLFTGYERDDARKTLIRWKPHEFMAATGETLRTEDSYKLQEEAFKEATRDKWVVTGASGLKDGWVEVVATLGGSREPGVEIRKFTLEPGVYDQGRFGFVIDPAVHKEVEEHASSPRR